MQASQVPSSLRDRLGPEATSGLLDLLQDARGEWRDDVVNLCTERFERRLMEETSRLRVEMAHGFAQLRGEMAQGRAQIREEMAQLRAEMTRGFSNERGELMKWMFLFWVGQVVAMAAIMSAMLRTVR